MFICAKSSDQGMLQSRRSSMLEKYFYAKQAFVRVFARISSDQGLFKAQSSDQGKFFSIKNLDPGRRWFYRSYESDSVAIHLALTL